MAEIEYLDRYYRGDQPILYRRKSVRPEINHKVVINIAKKAVDTHTAEMAGEPIQYVLRGTDEIKSEQIKRLNAIMDGEDKQYYDQELCKWRAICGTAYRFVGVATEDMKLLDESPFFFTVEEPTETFVVEQGKIYQEEFAEDKDIEDKFSKKVIIKQRKLQERLNNIKREFYYKTIYKILKS